MSSILGKMARGASQVLMPYAMEQAKAQIQQDRDARLQEYAQQNQETKFKQEQQLQTQREKFTSSEAEKSRENSNLQKSLDRNLQQQKLDLLSAEQQKTLENLDVQIKTGNLKLQQMKDANGVLAKLEHAKDPNVRGVLIDTLRVMQGKEPLQQWDFKVVQATDPDTLEKYQDLYRVSKSTGAVTAMTEHGKAIPGASTGHVAPEPAGTSYNSPEEVRSAYQNHEITKEQARTILANKFQQATGADNNSEAAGGQNAPVGQQPSQGAPSGGSPSGGQPATGPTFTGAMVSPEGGVQSPAPAAGGRSGLLNAATGNEPAPSMGTGAPAAPQHPSASTDPLAGYSEPQPPTSQQPERPTAAERGISKVKNWLVNRASEQSQHSIDHAVQAVRYYLSRKQLPPKYVDNTPQGAPPVDKSMIEQALKGALTPEERKVLEAWLAK